MKVLTYLDNSAFNYGEIETGIFGSKEELYKVTTPDGSIHYAVISGYTAHEIESVPDDFEPLKYCYTPEKGFYIELESDDNAEETV